MASYGFERSFLLIFSSRDDLVKPSYLPLLWPAEWKMPDPLCIYPSCYLTLFLYAYLWITNQPWLRHLCTQPPKPPPPKPPYFSLMYHLLVLFFQTAGPAFFAVAIRNSVKPGIGRKSYLYFFWTYTYNMCTCHISFIFANNSHLLCKRRKCQHRVLIVQALSEKATMAIWNMSANII